MFKPFNLSEMKSRIVLTALFAMAFSVTLAQDEEETKISKLPEIGLGVGIISFHGDVGTGNDITDLSKLRAGYNLRIEERLTPFASVMLNGIYGKIAESERNSTRNLNFESPLIQGDLQVLFRLDNGFIFSKDASVAPYLGAGIGYTKFDPHTDMKDKDGNIYHYWEDGSIRNLPQVDSNYYLAKTLFRDYTYETQLKDASKNYKRSTFSVPLTAGIKFKMSPEWGMSVNYTHYITFTDYLDNVADGGNDRYWFANFAIHYNIGGRSKDDDARYVNVDFNRLSKLDSDEDGVNDEDDMCQGTPKGADVNSKGCPKDDDGDGIPNYLDKQKDSPKGSVVDPTGVAINDDELERQQLMRDSLATERSEVFNQNPSLRSLQAIDAKIAASGQSGKNLPPKFASADINKDGIIQSSEISSVIDGFFEGSNDFTVEKINELIDYFFEQ